MFDVCTISDMAHIDTIFKLLPHTRQHVDACVATPVVHTSKISSCHKKKPFFCFTVAVKNSIMVGPLVFLL